MRRRPGSRHRCQGSHPPPLRPPCPGGAGPAARPDRRRGPREQPQHQRRRPHAAAAEPRWQDPAAGQRSQTVGGDGGAVQQGGGPVQGRARAVGAACVDSSPVRQRVRPPVLRAMMFRPCATHPRRKPREPPSRAAQPVSPGPRVAAGSAAWSRRSRRRRLRGAGRRAGRRRRDQPWEQIVAEPQGQTVDLWMYGGDERGNAYVDDVLAPAAAELGVTLRRVPVADTREAVRPHAGRARGRAPPTARGPGVGQRRQLRHRQAGRAPGCAAGPTTCRTRPTSTPTTRSCGGLRRRRRRLRGAVAQGPVHLRLRRGRVADPPDDPRRSCSTGPSEHPGRFTYPAPPDFTGSVFVRQALYAVSGGADGGAGRVRPGGVRRPGTRRCGSALRELAPDAVARGARPTRATRPRWTGSSPTARST